MAKLNENETKAIIAIVADCDELDGWGFTRPFDMVEALLPVFDGNYQRVGGYIAALIEKGLIELDAHENEVWVAPEVYDEYLIAC